MKRRHKTLIMIIIAGIVLGGGVIIGALAMKKTVSFFYSPQDVIAKPPKIESNIRLGGLVADGSVKKLANGITEFIVTDGSGEIKVSYQGVLPDLFREGQGVIAEGKFKTMDIFTADKILAKHDENYVPKEVADALKKSGQWKGAGDAVKK